MQTLFWVDSGRKKQVGGRGLAKNEGGVAFFPLSALADNSRAERQRRPQVNSGISRQDPAERGEGKIRCLIVWAMQKRHETTRADFWLLRPRDKIFERGHVATRRWPGGADIRPCWQRNGYFKRTGKLSFCRSGRRRFPAN